MPHKKLKCAHKKRKPIDDKYISNSISKLLLFLIIELEARLVFLLTTANNKTN